MSIFLKHLDFAPHTSPVGRPFVLPESFVLPINIDPVLLIKFELKFIMMKIDAYRLHKIECITCTLGG